MEAKGKSGQIAFDGEYVTISRKGLMARSLVGGGEKRLHVSQISAVQWKAATFATNGFIQFTLPGGIERRSRPGAQTNAALRDENSVVFSKGQQPAFEALRAALDTAIAAQHGPAPAQAGPSSVADELGKLAALREAGALTQAEFDQAKARLLGG